MAALDDSYTDHPSVGWYKTTKHILNIFQKDRFLDVMIMSTLRMPLHINTLC